MTERIPAHRPARLPRKAFDAAVVAVALAANVVGIIAWQQTISRTPLELVFLIALAILGSIPLAVRRTRPEIAFAFAAASFLAYQPLASPISPFVLLVALYSVAVYSTNRTSLVTITVVIPAVIAYVAISGLVIADRLTWRDVTTFALALTACWAIGNGIGARRGYLRTLEERAALLEQRRADEARRAVQDERARIAREMHDVVAHHVSMMVVQAGAARRVFASDAEKAVQAITAVETTGRAAMNEMRSLLGVLRADGDAEGRSPQPGVGQIEDLVARTKDAGVRVILHLEGTPQPLSPLVDLSIYRVVQEALTNVIKHAGPAHATVTLRYEPDGLVVEVIDDGQGTIGATGVGHGIMGMRERLAIFGGELQAGPRVGGGFTVRARVPMRAGETE